MKSRFHAEMNTEIETINRQIGDYESEKTAISNTYNANIREINNIIKEMETINADTQTIQQLDIEIEKMRKIILETTENIIILSKV
jgi:chromosome segregation ATPase